MRKRHLAVTLGVLAVVAIVIGATGSSGVSSMGKSVKENSGGLEAKIHSIYEKSVKECAAFRALDQDCVKTQFAENYRWEIIRDRDSIGAPGVPGPLPSGIASATADANPAQRSR